MFSGGSTGEAGKVHENIEVDGERRILSMPVSISLICSESQSDGNACNNLLGSSMYNR